MNKKLIMILRSVCAASAISLCAASAIAADTDENLVAIGQGISSPTSTSTVNYSNGFTHENPVGVLYQNGSRVSLQYDQNDSGNSKGYGAEVGYGKKEFGLAIGYYKRDCTGCEGRLAADVAASSGSFGFGLRLAEDQYGVGLLFGVTDPNRFGIMVEFDETAGNGNKVTSYGLGYSYVNPSFTLTLDASKQQHENSSANNDVLMVTPGLSVRASFLQLSVSDRIVMDNTNHTRTEDLWLGVGVGGDSWHLAGYSDYVNDLALSLSFNF